MPLNARTTRHQEKASTPKWKLQSTYMPGEFHYVLVWSTPKTCRAVNKASPGIIEPEATNARELQPESGQSLAGRRGKTAPPRILSTKNKTADSKHTPVLKVEGWLSVIDDCDADFVRPRKPPHKSTRPSRPKLESSLDGVHVSSERHSLGKYCKTIMSGASNNVPLRFTSLQSLRSATNIVLSLLSLLVVRLKLCMSLAILPARVVAAVFSSQPPWCASSTESASCWGPSFEDRQRPHQTSSYHQRRPSTELMWALDALSLDFSV